jgi:hypothetical protein
MAVVHENYTAQPRGFVFALPVGIEVIAVAGDD